MNFTTFLSEEKITAADFENFITVAFNGGPEKDKDTPIKSMDAYNAYLPALKKIAKALKGAGFKGRMIQTGKAKGKLNPTWLGTDKTPKADMVVGNNGISLKKRGGSQLGSPKQAETMSTFNAAVGFMDSQTPGEATRLAKELSDLMLEFAVPKKLGNIGEFLKRIKNPAEYRKTRGTERKLANEYLAKTDAFQMMSDKVRTFFANNDTFRNFFVYEMATGAEKFRPDPSAAANYIVAFDESGSTSIHKISNGYGKIGPYIPQLASTVKFRMAWKTHSSKSQKTFPSMRIDVKDDVSDEITFQSMFEEHFSELNENIFTDAKNFLSNIKDKIQDFIKKAAAHIYNLGKRGIMAILRFLGITPTSISVSNAIIEETLTEAKYEGKEVTLDDPFRLPQGSNKKFGVYVKNPKSGNVVMVKFGDPNLSIKRDDPDRLKNFRARHNCDQKTDKTTPGYWSCKFWEKNKPVSKLLTKGKVSEEEGCGCGCGCDEQEVNEVNIPGYKGWVNPKTGKTQIIQGHSPYHVMMIANNPRFYGLTEKLILNNLIERYKEMDSPIPEEDAEYAMQRLKSGERDIDHHIELLAMEKGWVRFVEGEYAEISGRKKFNDRELRKILQLIDEETPLTMKSKTTMGLQIYKPVSKTDVNVKLYGSLEMNEIKNLIKGRRRGDKQTEIGRTMAMFREYVEMTEGEWKDEKDEREHNKLFMKSLKVMPKSPQQKKIIQQMNALRKKNGLELLDEAKRVPKTRKNQDPDTHSDLYTDENPEGTIHGLGFKDVETAEASVRKIKASDRTHAHKIQAAIAMEQRAKVMKKTAEAAVYRKFIEEMKKKTKEMNEEAYLPGQATTKHGGKSGRGGKPGPRMSRQRRHREEVLMHLITNGIKVTNQPSMVTQKGSSDTFAVAKNQVKKAEKILDDFFKRAYIKKSGMRRDNYTIISESVELNESFFDFYMGVLVAGGGEMTAQQAIGAMLTISSIPIALYGMMGFRHVQRKLNIGGKRLSAARKKLDDIIQDDVRVAVFVDWLQEQPYFDKAIDKLEDANADLKQAYDEKDGAAEEIAQKDIQRILSEFGRALKPDWDKFAAKEGFTKLTDKADIGSGISRNLLNRVNKAGRKYNITNYRVYEDVNEVYKDSGLGDWFGKGGGGGKEEGGWDRYNASGERIGKCGDAKKGASYSACLSAEKAKQLGKAKIADFVKRKRDAQKKAGDKAKGGESKKGQKPVMVKTGAKGLDKKNESYMSFKSFISEENVPNNPALWKKAIAKAKSKFDVYPSAYANAWASKWYKSKGGTWSKK